MDLLHWRPPQAGAGAVLLDREEADADAAFLDQEEEEAP
jgi:hypothetical protein